MSSIIGVKGDVVDFISIGIGKNIIEAVVVKIDPTKGLTKSISSHIINSIAIRIDMATNMTKAMNHSNHQVINAITVGIDKPVIDSITIFVDKSKAVSVG